jgi:hypothetical protein
MKYSKDATEKELAYLREVLKPGSEVYTTVKQVAKSGMSRTMTLHIVQDGRICGVTYSAAVVLGEPQQKDGSIRVHGCGMDMGFEVVYRLSRRLFPDGFKPRDAGKDYGRNGTSADDIDKDGGYALKQRWM